MYRIIITACLLATAYSAVSQQMLVFSRASIAQGLNTNRIKCSWQDEKGFLWIGTENGLQRFDGRKFVQFHNPDPLRRLAPAAVDQLIDAGNNEIWVRQGHIIGRFDRSHFSFLQANISANKIFNYSKGLHLFVDSEKNAFVISDQEELLAYDKVTNTFTNKNLPIAVPPRWPLSRIFKHGNNYWLSGDSGLAVYNVASKTLTYEKRNPGLNKIFMMPAVRQVHHFIVDRNNTYWIAYWKTYPLQKGMSIMRYDPEKEKVLLDTAIGHIDGKIFRDVSQLLETSSGQVWACGTNTLLQFNESTNKFFQHETSRTSEFEIKCRVVNQLFEDREKNLWLSTDNGLYFTSPTRDDVLNIAFNINKEKEVLVQSIIQTSNNECWLATWGNGIIYLGPDFLPLPMANNFTGNGATDKFLSKVWDLHQHRKTGLIWVVAHAAYLTVMHPVTKKIMYLMHPPSLNEEIVPQIAENKQGDLWFGTLGGRLVRWKNGSEYSNEAFELIQQFKSAINTLLIDNNNRIWIGTAKQGIFVLDGSGKNLLYHFINRGTALESFGNNIVSDIVQYNDSIFIAGNNGLSIINVNSGIVETKTIYDGLPGTNVSKVNIDNDGIIWMITNNGLSSYQLGKNNFTTYNQKDGIVHANSATSSKCKFSNGDLWFGGENVVFGFRPKQLRNNIPPPAVTITDFKLFSEFLPADSLLALNRVTLQPGQNSFSIYFSVLSFIQQDKLTYYYMLKGVDKTWNVSDKISNVNYSLLPPGHYTFSVKCENMQGLSSAITNMKIYVRPPFYRTWWFTVLVALLIVIAGYGIYRLRINRLLAVERLRNKVARDLHDDMGSTLSTINILSSMAKSKLQTNNLQASEYISKISDNSQRMMEAMDDIVWSIKPDNDSIQKITGRMREFATHMLEAKDIELTFRVDENIKDVKLNMEARRDFFLIFKEAINNIAKYAKCRQVDVHIACHQQRLLLSIKDDGVGFDVANADNGNGLGNMQKRAEALKARIQILSAPMQGTRISLNMPVR